MTLPEFYVDVIKTLNSNKTEYLIVGGHAVILHGYVRLTADLDIWLNDTESNLLLFQTALLQLGYSQDKCENAIRFLKEKKTIKIPQKDDLIEIFGSGIIKTVFKQAYNHREIVNIDGVDINFIGFDDLIQTKLRSNRFKDLNDARELQNIKKISENSGNQNFNDEEGYILI